MQYITPSADHYEDRPCFFFTYAQWMMSFSSHTCAACNPGRTRTRSLLSLEFPAGLLHLIPRFAKSNPHLYDLHVDPHQTLTHLSAARFGPPM